MAVIRQMSEDDMTQVEWALAANVAVNEDLLASYHAAMAGLGPDDFRGSSAGQDDLGLGSVISGNEIDIPIGEYSDPDFIPSGDGGGDLTTDFRNLRPGETPYSHPGLEHAQHPETHPLGQDYAEDFYDENAGEGVGGLLVAGAAAGAFLRPALAILRAIMGRASRITREHWDRLPGWAQQALTFGGFVVGGDLALEIPGIPGESFILDQFQGGGPTIPFGAMGSGGMGVTIIGGWNANGVRFYRLSNGSLAVKNKKGRWKVWKPKKPIVIYPGGASNLRTLLKADKAVDNQIKKLKKIINRRNPPRRQNKPKMIDGATGSIIQVR